MADEDIIEPENPSAFPFGIDRANATHIAAGMTLRDYFAAHAPPPPDDWLRNQSYTPPGTERKTPTHAESLIVWAYVYADEMLKQRHARYGGL